MNTKFPDHIKHLGVSELLAYMDSHPLDTTKNSRQLINEFGSIFRCFIPTATVVLAALLTNHAIVPIANGEIFRFISMEE